MPSATRERPYIGVDIHCQTQILKKSEFFNTNQNKRKIKGFRNILDKERLVFVKGNYLMLASETVAATIAVKNLEESREFYENKLGLKQQETDGENYISYKSGTSSLLVYQSKFAGGYKATVATWAVGDEIENIVKELSDKGVPFEHYPDMLPNTKLVGDIHIIGNMKNAWAKDPDGNILCFVNT